MPLTCLSSFHVRRFFSVGRYLRAGIWTLKKVEKARYWSSLCARKTRFPSS